MLDSDTFTSPKSASVARLAAGAAVQAAEHALRSRETAFALVRPPGHHAERERAMGFCLYNNVAVAAAAVCAMGVQRVAIVDIDVHHGNGTQAIFEDDPRILYVSTHQYPYYPGTGGVDEVGTNEGKGFTVNVPLEAGAGDDDFALVYDAVIEPVLDAFRPELLLVSAGYDAHERDPLGGMRLSTAGYARITGRLASVAERAGSGLAMVTEGGYDLGALSECLEASVEAVRGSFAKGAREFARSPGESSHARRGTRAIAAVKSAHRGYWRL